jgi:putative lipoic acid-binding regulatory protein
MFCDPNGGSSFHCPPLIITFSSFVVDSHCLPPIITQCCNYVVDVDPKGEKLVDEDVIVVIESLQPIANLPTPKMQVSKKGNYNSTRIHMTLVKVLYHGLALCFEVLIFCVICIGWSMASNKEFLVGILEFVINK